MLGKQFGHAVAKLVANRCPGARDLKVSEMMGHEAGARAEYGQVAASLLHQSELVGFDGLAQFIIGNLQFGNCRHRAAIIERGKLPVAPGLERGGRGSVVAVAVDDHCEHSPCGYGQWVVRTQDRGFSVEANYSAIQ